VRAQVTALACTLPAESGKPLSRWSSAELAAQVIAQKIVPRISPSTIRLWLRAERIKPWQYHCWQKSTDPRFLEKATVVLRLYEQAAALARRGQMVICADEKTCLQALTLTDGVSAAEVGRAVRVGHRYRRRGILNLFAALLVHRGQTMACCYERKRFVEFQSFLAMIFGSLWCRGIQVLHLILDNGPTHAPKQIESWIAAQRLAFTVNIHWLPINASWLDQVEIIFSPLQRKALQPNHFADREQLRQRVLGYLEERNHHAKPIRWTYTKADLRKDWGQHLRACA
jgi:DDE superfamily endonuclease